MRKPTAGAVQILPIAEAHIEGFRECLDSVVREGMYLAMDRAPDLDRMREFVRSNIQNGHPQFVAVRAGEVVGWCDILPENAPDAARCGRLGIGVRRDCRGRGVGLRLIETTIAAARRQGCRRVVLNVRASNRPAIALYEKVGFRPADAPENAPDGDRLEMVLML
ncbi:MAG: GNAT family N-acetyltransferase [Phycisphaerae bacterium]|nr:GNAT family N-acetyltransferase [Phycisphaerae bacterium]